jgi:H+/Cl- antiporter ClcA
MIMDSKYTQWILGILTFGSIIGIFITAFLVPGLLDNPNAHKDIMEIRDLVKDIFMSIFLGLYLFYFFYATRSSVVPENKRTLWVALIFFGSMCVMPFFWYHYILQRSEFSNEDKET